MRTKLPFSLDVVIPRILEIGVQRAPNEACGLVIPDLEQEIDGWVHELVNRSEDPTTSYQFDGSALKGMLTDPSVWEDVLIWHTHPSGRVGPSPWDVKNQHPQLKGKYLVVALPRGEAVLF
jgi:proteasome lid subunit RPN8/RPN11